MAVAVKSQRIDFRANAKQKSILEKAAGLKNLTLSSYILTSSLRQAQLDLAENDTLLLSDKSRNLVMSALENPPKPNAALKSLFR